MSNAANIRWGDVSVQFKRELENTRERLETAALADVAALQGQVAAMKSIIQWFEHGAFAERAILFSPNPHDTQD